MKQIITILFFCALSNINAQKLNVFLEKGGITTQSPALLPEVSASFDIHKIAGVNPGVQVVGWDYRTFQFDVANETLLVMFSDNFATHSESIGAGDLQSLANKVIDVYNTFIGITGNTSNISAFVSGSFLYVKVTNLSENLQMTIRNDNSGVWGDGVDDFEGDGLQGRVPYSFVVGNKSLEYFDTPNQDVDTYSSRFLTKLDLTTPLVGEYRGWSNPEGVQWNNIPEWDNRVWRVKWVTLDTDGLGVTSTSFVTQAFASFEELITVLNDQLQTYGSSFRIKNVGNDRILLTDLAGNFLLDADTYFGDHLFNNMHLLIEDLTANNWLVKAVNPKGVILNTTYSQVGLKWGKIVPNYGEKSFYQTSGNSYTYNSTVGEIVVDSISIPAGHIEIEYLVNGIFTSTGSRANFGLFSTSFIGSSYGTTTAYLANEMAPVATSKVIINNPSPTVIYLKSRVIGGADYTIHSSDPSTADLNNDTNVTSKLIWKRL